MCLVYAFYLWLSLWSKRTSPRFVVITYPKFHVLVLSKFGLFHGTDKGGCWHIEQLRICCFTRWLRTNACCGRVLL